MVLGVYSLFWSLDPLGYIAAYSEYYCEFTPDILASLCLEELSKYGSHCRSSCDLRSQLWMVGPYLGQSWDSHGHSIEPLLKS